MFSKPVRYLLLAPVALFLLLEITLWAFVRIPLEPKKRLDLSNDIPGLKRDVRLEFDQDMVRYLDWTDGEKPAGAVRILCLGGSATFAMLQNAEDTWWGKLHTELKARGYKVETAARGQEREGILSAAVMADGLMEELQPDIVIGNFGFDDVVGPPVAYQYDAAKAQRLPGPARTAGWKQAILTVSQTARLLRRQARNNEAALLQNAHGRPDYYKSVFEKWRTQLAETPPQPGPEREGPNDPLQEYLDGWRLLKTLADRHQAALVLTGEATLHDAVTNLTQQEHLIALIPLEEGRAIRPAPGWVEREMTRYGDAAEDLAAEWNAPWLNLNGRVPRSLENFLTDNLMTDAGAAAAAAELAPVVEPLVKQRSGK